MPTGGIYLSNTTQPITTWCGSTTADSDTTIADSGKFNIAVPAYPNEYYDWKWGIPNNKKGGDENMRYLYEVILVSPKNDTFLSVQIIARSETSALMKAYDKTDMFDGIDFDDLKTSCRVLMEWKKEKSLKKAIETIKEAVE